MKFIFSDVSLYERVTKKTNVKVSVLKVFEGIRQGNWKTNIGSIRAALRKSDELRREGLNVKGSENPSDSTQDNVSSLIEKQIREALDKAQTTKSQLPAFTTAGVFGQQSRSQDSLLSLSGLIGVDVDGLGEEQAPITRDLIFNALSCVVCSHVSASGRGVHFYVRHDLTDPNRWGELYTAISNLVNRQLKVECDPACKDVPRLSFVSYDPDLKLRPWQEAAVFSLPAAPAVCPVYSGLPGDDMQEIGSAEPRAARIQRVGEVMDRLPEDSPQLPVRDHSQQEIEQYFCRLLTFYPLDLVGHRHQNVVSIGRNFRKNGYSTSDFDQLLDLIDTNFGGASFSRKEIRSALQWCDRRILPEERKERKATKCQSDNVTLALSTEQPPKNEEMNEEKTRYNLEKQQKKLPTFSNLKKVKLPSIFNKNTKKADSVRILDIDRLAKFAVLGSAMPNVSCEYGDNHYYPTFFVCVVGKAASGKSAILHPMNMLNEIEHSFEMENERKRAEYEAQLAQLRNARPKKDGKTDEVLSALTKPVYHYFKLASSTSRSQLVINLVNTCQNGAIICTSEIDDLVSAFNTDYGKFDPVLRQLFEHENVKQHYKTDEQAIVAECPKCAMLMSGTEDQFCKLVNYQNGLGSRIAGYVLADEDEWKDMSPDYTTRQPADVYAEMAPTVLEMYNFLKESKTEVRLTEKQWKKFQKVFSGLFTQGKMENDQRFPPIVKRLAVTCLRMISVLVGLRKFRSRDTTEIVFAIDTEVVSCLAIAKVLFEHQLSLAQLVGGKAELKLPQEPTNVTHIWLAHMPDEFKVSDVMEFVEKNHLGCSRRTILRQLKMLKEMGQITQEAAHRPYRKTEELKSLLADDNLD